MSTQSCDPPLEATVESFSTLDMIGKLVLADGREMKFGGSALQDFTEPPATGESVFVHAFEHHPRLGLRAKLVKKTATTEAERHEVEARAADDERARQRAHERAWEAFRQEFEPAPIDPDWVPSIDYDCPPLAMIPRYIDELDFERMDDGLERLAELLDITLPGEFDPDLEGTSLPWNRFWDPMLWPIANDGGGNLVGVHLAASLYQDAHAPAVFWFHETERHWLLADDLETFLRQVQALAHAPAPSLDTPFLTRLASAEKAAWDDPGDWSWLWPQTLGARPGGMSETFYRERSLIAEISKRLSDAPRVGEQEAQMTAHREAFEKILEVEAIYQAAGWQAPLNHLRFQRRRLFR